MDYDTLLGVSSGKPGVSLALLDCHCSSGYEYPLPSTEQESPRKDWEGSIYTASVASTVGAFRRGCHRMSNQAPERSQ